MTLRLLGRLVAIAAPLLLWGCVLTPGKFTSTLSIDRDRSFTFGYRGEVIALDLAKAFASGMAGAHGAPDAPDVPDKAPGTIPSAIRIALQQLPTDADTDAKNRAIADALRREPGYRSVEYRGNGVFMVDYRLSGRLSHSFVYPYNFDATAIFPFLVLELRGPDTVRMKAPAFGSSDQPDQSPGDANIGQRRDGSFVLDTDAEIVSQNNEDGAVAANGRRRITWRVTPITNDAPLAVLRLAPLAP